jgi:hypothetical protein
MVLKVIYMHVCIYENMHKNLYMCTYVYVYVYIYVYGARNDG